MQKTLKAREEAVRSLGGSAINENRAAQEHTRKFEPDLAQLLVEDLFRTSSNNTTRGWYTAVFRFFERSSLDIAEKALLPMMANFHVR